MDREFRDLARCGVAQRQFDGAAPSHFRLNAGVVNHDSGFARIDTGEGYE